MEIIRCSHSIQWVTNVPQATILHRWVHSCLEPMSKTYRVRHEESELRGMETKAKLNENCCPGWKALHSRNTITLICPSAETGFELECERIWEDTRYTQRPKKTNIAFGWACSFPPDFPTQGSKKFASMLQLRDLKRKYVWGKRKKKKKKDRKERLQGWWAGRGWE